MGGGREAYLLCLRRFWEREGWPEIRYKSGPDQANPHKTDVERVWGVGKDYTPSRPPPFCQNGGGVNWAETIRSKIGPDIAGLRANRTKPAPTPTINITARPEAAYRGGKAARGSSGIRPWRGSLLPAWHRCTG